MSQIWTVGSVMLVLMSNTPRSTSFFFFFFNPDKSPVVPLPYPHRGKLSRTRTPQTSISIWSTNLSTKQYVTETSLFRNLSTLPTRGLSPPFILAGVRSLRITTYSRGIPNTCCDFENPTIAAVYRSGDGDTGCEMINSLIGGSTAGSPR